MLVMNQPLATGTYLVVQGLRIYFHLNVDQAIAYHPHIFHPRHFAEFGYDESIS